LARADWLFSGALEGVSDGGDSQGYCDESGGRGATSDRGLRLTAWSPVRRVARASELLEADERVLLGRLEATGRVGWSISRVCGALSRRCAAQVARVLGMG
jgi:hypothetical protein